MSSPSGTAVLLCLTALVALIIAAFVVLVWEHDVTGQEFTTFVGTLGIGGLIAGVSHLSVNAGAKAAAKAPEGK